METGHSSFGNMLALQSWGPEFNIQHPRENHKLDVVVFTSNPQSRKEGDKPARLVSFKWLYLWKIMDCAWRIIVLSSGWHTHTNICMSVHTQEDTHTKFLHLNHLSIKIGKGFLIFILSCCYSIWKIVVWSYSVPSQWLIDFME